VNSAVSASSSPAEAAPAGAGRRLTQAHNLWLATARPDGRPHLVPVWFVWVEGIFYVCTAPASVKARNLEHDARVVVSLEDGSNPLICEAEASVVEQPWPEGVVTAFRSKYDWRIRREAEYTRLLALRPRRWVAW
jgi:hypothetical protein